MWIIETLVLFGHAEHWDSYAVGDSANAFETQAEAQIAIEGLRKLGPDWAGGEYRVVRCTRRPSCPRR
mgnify:CR=1 FL=1